jgi:hypothetical protein
MSNRFTIQPTRFEDMPTGEVSYGVRVYDDYASFYDNTWDVIPPTDREVFVRCLDIPEFADILQAFKASSYSPIYVGDIGYARSVYETWEAEWLAVAEREMLQDLGLDVPKQP